jgi:hypothetical protein
MSGKVFNGLKMNGYVPDIFTGKAICTCGREFTPEGFSQWEAQREANRQKTACFESHDTSIEHDDYMIAQGVMRANRIHWPNPTLERCEATSAALHADGRLR